MARKYDITHIARPRHLHQRLLAHPSRASHFPLAQKSEAAACDRRNSKL
jgi:hypothetical protein